MAKNKRGERMSERENSSHDGNYFHRKRGRREREISREREEGSEREEETKTKEKREIEILMENYFENMNTRVLSEPTLLLLLLLLLFYTDLKIDLVKVFNPYL